MKKLYSLSNTELLHKKLKTETYEYFEDMELVDMHKYEVGLLSNHY